MRYPHITCICPTYKRPRLLQNAVACFEAQEYQHRSLIILDDAAQFDYQQGNKWTLISQSMRYPSLPEKFDALIKMAPQADIIALWEDDDIYLPWHLSEIAKVHTRPLQYFIPNKHVWSNYALPKGEVQIEGSAGRFHASWAFTQGLLKRLGGYPRTNRLDFDQQMGSNLTRGAGEATSYGSEDCPSYVYRWGNGHYHGSQQGEEGYQNLWDRLGAIPVPFVGELVPQMDAETRKVVEHVSKKREQVICPLDS